MYSAVMLMAFGLSFLLSSWVVLALAVSFGLIVLRLIPIEEALLESAYADAYRTLRSRTWCLIPWVY
jgi:protein-S-isoprenylcysteine O-methyltransferase Ste14